MTPPEKQEGTTLTPELLQAAFDGIKARSDRLMRTPRGPCGCTMTTVSPRTLARLKAEGGSAICATCGAFFRIPAPTTQEDT